MRDDMRIRHSFPQLHMVRIMLLGCIGVLFSTKSWAQYDFLAGIDPPVPRSDQPFEIQLHLTQGCWYITTPGGTFMELRREPGLVRATVGLSQDLTCTTPPLVFGVATGPYPAGDYTLELYGAPNGQLDQQSLLDTFHFTIAETRVPQPAVIPAGHPAGLAVLSGLALLLGWLRLRRGIG